MINRTAAISIPGFEPEDFDAGESPGQQQTWDTTELLQNKEEIV